MSLGAQSTAQLKKLDYDAVTSILQCKNQASNILQMEHRYESPLIMHQMKEFMKTAKDQRDQSFYVINQFKNKIEELNTRSSIYQIYNRLHNEILLFKQEVNAINEELIENVSDEEKSIKQTLIDKVTGVVREVYADYEVGVYGSHCTGLSLHWSDIDMVVYNEPYESVLSQINDRLHEVKDRGPNGEGDWIIKTEFIETARWPLIVVTCSLSTLVARDKLTHLPKNPKLKALYEQEICIDICQSYQSYA